MSNRRKRTVPGAGFLELGPNGTFSNHISGADSAKKPKTSSSRQSEAQKLGLDPTYEIHLSDRQSSASSKAREEVYQQPFDRAARAQAIQVQQQEEEARVAAQALAAELANQAFAFDDVPPVAFETFGPVRPSHC